MCQDRKEFLLHTPKPMLFGQMIILASSSHHVIILWFGKRWPPTDFSWKKKPVTENKLPWSFSSCNFPLPILSSSTAAHFIWWQEHFWKPISLPRFQIISEKARFWTQSFFLSDRQTMILFSQDMKSPLRIKSLSGFSAKTSTKLSTASICFRPQNMPICRTIFAPWFSNMFLSELFLFYTSEDMEILYIGLIFPHQKW